jgi:hypothetical protein
MEAFPYFGETAEAIRHILSLQQYPRFKRYQCHISVCRRRLSIIMSYRLFPFLHGDILLSSGSCDMDEAIMIVQGGVHHTSIVGRQPPRR